MGYNTWRNGSFDVTPPLNKHEVTFLNKLNSMRHEDDASPGYYCPWVASEDGSTIDPDDSERPYEATEWIQFLIDNYLTRRGDGAALAAGRDPTFALFTFDHVVSGDVFCDGEESDDHWILEVRDNVAREITGRIVYEEPTIDADAAREWLDSARAAIGDNSTNDVEHEALVAAIAMIESALTDIARVH
jgi:hypothetical protein